MQGTGALHPPTEPKFTHSGIPERLFPSIGILLIDSQALRKSEERKGRHKK